MRGIFLFLMSIMLGVLTPRPSGALVATAPEMSATSLPELNKRNLPNVAEITELKARLKTGRCGYVETVATTGRGVAEVLTEVIRLAT